MRHDLLTLELVLAIANERSITRGAERVHLALASASKRVVDLESRLGVRLFTRRARSTEPTEACKVLLKHLAVVQTALDSMNQEAMEFSRGVRGHARILVEPEVLADDLPSQISRFSRNHAEVRVSMEEASSPEIETRIERGEADVGIFIRPPTGSRMLMFPYVRGHWVALVPQGHSLIRRERVTLDDLLAFNLLGMTRANALSGCLHHALASRGLSFEGKLTATGIETTAAFVEAGAGIALVSDMQARRCVGMRRVAFVHLAEDWAEFKAVIGVARREKLPVLVKRMVEALTSHAVTRFPLDDAALSIAGK